MEETRNIARVGNYSTEQAHPEDCNGCHSAKFATIIVDGLCLDCREKAFKAELADICTQLRGLPGPNGSRLDGENGRAAAVMAACDGYEMENGDLKATIESLKSELAKEKTKVAKWHTCKRLG